MIEFRQRMNEYKCNYVHVKLLSKLLFLHYRSVCSHILIKIDSQDDDSSKEPELTSTEKKETL